MKFGPEPAHQTGALFGGADSVELDQMEENVLGGKIRRPAVGFGNGTIEIVVEIPENRDETAFVNELACVAERLTGAELIEDVVHFG